MSREPTQLERHNEAKARGCAWGVFKHYGEAACRAGSRPDPDKPGWQIFSMAGVEPDYYGVASRFDSGMERGRFKTARAAERKAAELNRLDVQGPLDAAFAARRKRLKRLAPDYVGYLYDGPPEARWPVRPGRYLVRIMGHGWHAEDFWELAEDLPGVKAILLEDEQTALRVIDLDTGEEVPFERTVSVTVEGL